MKFTNKIGALFVAVLLAISTSPSQAVLHVWADGDSSWFTPANWAPATVPTAADNTQVNNGGTARVNGTGNTANANTLTLGNLSGDSGTVRVNNDNQLVIAGNLRIGDGGDGTMVLTDTSVTTVAGNLVVGNQNGSNGNLTIRDSAELSVSGGWTIGNQAGSNGNVDISAGGFPLGGTSNGALIIGNSGTGMMVVHDGGFGGTFAGLTLGNAATGSGTLIVRNTGSVAGAGNLVVGPVNVGDLGFGDLEVRDGGVFQMNGGDLRVGRQAGSNGTVLVTGAGSSFNMNGAGHDAFIGGGAAGPGGQGELRIVNGGTFNANNNMTVWGPGSGDRGTLSVDSTYTLNVPGTLTFSGGRLNAVGDGVDFTNDVILNNVPGPDLNGMHVNVSDDNTMTLDSFLSGNGQLVKNGTGTMILTNGANAYTGGNVVNNGTFVLATNNALGIANSGDLTLNGGTFKTVTGSPLVYFEIRNFFANGGTLVTQVGSSTTGVNNDEMLVAGFANLSTNSNLFAHQLTGFMPNNGDRITIIDTNTGVFGTFAQGEGDLVPNDFVGLIQPFAEYGDPFTVDLVFGFAASFQSVAKTPNQIATAAALDAAVAANCIPVATNFLGNVPINTLRHAYDLIAPEELASMYEASFAQSFVNSSNLQHRMDDIRWGSTGFCADGFVIQDNHGYTKNDGKSVADKNVVEQTAPPNYRWGGFITGSGELTKTGDESLNDPGAAGYQLNEAGFTMGVDYRVTDHWAIGLSGAYSHTTGNLVDNGRLNTDGGKMGLYTTWGNNGFYVDAAASGGWNQYDTRRSAYLGQETGSTDGAEFNGMVAAGYDWKKGCWTFGPTASFEYTYVEFNSFTESDTSLIPLHFPDQNQEAYRSNLGFRIAHEQVMKPGEGLTVVPELRAAWRHDFGPSAYAIDSNFVGCDDIFTVHGPWVGRDSAVVDLGLTAYCTPGLSAYIFYDGQFGRDNYNNNAISGGFRVAF